MEREEEQFSVGAWQTGRGSLVSLPSRDSPDGQSDQDIRHTSPDASGDPGPPSVPVLATPPSTPLTTNGNYKPTVTPSMIRSALEALSLIEDKDTPISMTPCEEPMLPEAVTSALTAWISSQNLSSLSDTPLTSPPPSTPLEGSGESPPHVGISASDLITALSSLMGGGGGETSGESSGTCSVPQATPQEGFPEWARLGIRAEEVIQALSALTITEEGADSKDEDKMAGSKDEEEMALSNEDKMAGSKNKDEMAVSKNEDKMAGSKEEAVSVHTVPTEEDCVSVGRQSSSSSSSSSSEGNEHRAAMQPDFLPPAAEDSVLYS